MDRLIWEQWRDATDPATKRRLAQKLLTDNDRLAEYYVASFCKSSSYHTDNMRDDLLQAARIGILRALTVWQPDKGGFSAVGWQWSRHEMQQVARHASRITVPKSAFLPKAKQDEAARFYAVHGRDPEPQEIGITQATADRSRKAMLVIVDEHQADDVTVSDASDDASPEAEIDRKRDTAALKLFIVGLGRKDRRDFWSGKRPDLAAQAKAFVEERRSAPKGRQDDGDVQ